MVLCTKKGKDTSMRGKKISTYCNRVEWSGGEERRGYRNRKEKRGKNIKVASFGEGDCVHAADLFCEEEVQMPVSASYAGFPID
ncbi:hypothetical protein E2C01_070775 [Portunus trituberculatus]|uniref:Uncharacterized protein n=1 Tax=Portunus trituberculatus TaxID=210409 RepID=A0A5B7I2J6_PORTR|nr:hypothetical protein [Portunus trituberculatus]